MPSASTHQGSRLRSHDLQVDSPRGPTLGGAHPARRRGQPAPHRRLPGACILGCADKPAWTAATTPKTPSAARSIYDALGASRKRPMRPLDRTVPGREAWRRGVVISPEFEPWYASRPEQSHAVSIGSTIEDYLIAGRLAPRRNRSARAGDGRASSNGWRTPSGKAAYQSKGLVVGYVQSGKTANFPGVIAKAIDAGYRLIIVSPGTTDLLRAQTTATVDKELVGQENLLRGVDLDDPESVGDHRLLGDPDWDGVRRAWELPSSADPQAGHPAVDDDRRRLPEALSQGIEALDFQRFVPTQSRSTPPRTCGAFQLASPSSRRTLRASADFVKDLNKITARLLTFPRSSSMTNRIKRP